MEDKYRVAHIWPSQILMSTSLDKPDGEPLTRLQQATPFESHIREMDRGTLNVPPRRVKSLP